MSTKAAVSIASLGSVVALASALADVVGLGRYEGFGSDQVWGTIGGGVVAMIGFGFYLCPNARGRSQGE